MSLYDKITDLPVEIESYELEGLEQPMGPEFTRYTTVITMKGGGAEGAGEDVIYDGLDHMALRDAGPVLPITGARPLGELFELLGQTDLFPDSPPVREESRLYRRWGFESAALDLALRQAGRSLADVVGRPSKPLTFVVSRRLGDEDPAGTLDAILAKYPNSRFKLDPSEAWTAEVVEALSRHDRIDVVDLKGHYVGTPVDLAPDPELYVRVAEAFPSAWIEDPALTDETRPALEPFKDRFTWDAPLHSVEDIAALETPPRAINIKPSRFGPVETLFAVYELCEERGIKAYAGGQGELGCGRDHIQYLASVFHPDAGNDCAPRGYNAAELRDGLPQPPLELPIAETGFRLEESAG